MEEVLNKSFSDWCNSLKEEYKNKLKIHLESIPVSLSNSIYTPDYGKIEVNILRYSYLYCNKIESAQIKRGSLEYIHPNIDTYPICVWSITDKCNKDPPHNRPIPPFSSTMRDIVIDNYGNMYTTSPTFRGFDFDYYHNIYSIESLQCTYKLPNVIIDFIKRLGIDQNNRSYNRPLGILWNYPEKNINLINVMNDTLKTWIPTPDYKGSFIHSNPSIRIPDFNTSFISPKILQTIAQHYHELVFGTLSHDNAISVIKTHTDTINILKTVNEELKKENVELKTTKKKIKKWLCVICQDRDKEIVYLPCSHLVSCQQCSDQMNNKICAICNGKVTGTIKFFNC
jgi:hypothetical protein